MLGHIVRLSMLPALLFQYKERDEGDRDAVSEDAFIAYLIMVVGLTLMAGLMSGLTIGLLSMDNVDIEILKRCGSANEKKYAAGVESVLANQHYLLCTLVVWNAAAMETLPIFLDRIADPVTAIVLSVTVVLVFGEILPQSICTKYGLAVGYYTKYLLMLLMFIAFPVAYPLGALLDTILGKGHAVFRSRGQIKALVDVHGQDHQLGGNLTKEEVSVISGALDLTHKTADEAMTPLDKVFMLSMDQVLDAECVQAIMAKGHSRIPVYASTRTDLVGILLAKELLRLLPLSQGTQTRVADVPLRSLPSLRAETPMYDVLQLFKTGRAHMACLCAAPEGREKSAEASALLEEAMSNAQGMVSASCFEFSAELPNESSEASLKAASDSGALPVDDSVLLPLLKNEQKPSVSKLNVHAIPINNGETTVDLRPALPTDDVSMGKVVGIVTIEDVIEELLGVEIVDETDQYVDNLQTQQVDEKELTSSLPPTLRKVMNVALFKAKSRRAQQQLARKSAILHDHHRALSDFAQRAESLSRAASTSRRARGKKANAEDATQVAAVQEAATKLETWIASHPEVSEAMDVISSAVGKSAHGSRSNSFFASGSKSLQADKLDAIADS